MKSLYESCVAWVEVDLAAYRHNLSEVARHTRTRVLAVVKANGYGHGIVPIARAAVEARAAHLGVAMVAEGVRLRQAGVDGIPILVMGASLEAQADLVAARSEEHTSELQSLRHLVCRLLLEKKKSRT